MDLQFLVVALVNLAVAMGIVLSMGGMLTWVERKQGAVMANRIGADRAYLPIPLPGPGGLKVRKNFTAIGLFHLLADGGKMFLKEDYTPPFVDKVVFNLAPWLGVIPVIVTFAVVPFGGPFQPGVAGNELLSLIGLASLGGSLLSWFGDATYQLQLADLNVGLLFVFAMGSAGIFGSALGGWSSGNKYSLMGALRSSSQMISYEVFMGLSILGLLLIYGTVNLNHIAQLQGDFWMWGIFLQPHMFFVFMAAVMAENKRVPFDMAEAESELVAGYFTEYTAMKMGLFMMSEFMEVAVIAGLVTTLFLGAYHVPGVHAVTDTYYWALHPELTPGNSLFGMAVAQWVVVALRFLSFMVKLLFLCWLQILIRWTLPKFRYDQIMRLGWKIMLPLSIANLVVTAIVVYLIG